MPNFLGLQCKVMLGSYGVEDTRRGGGHLFPFLPLQDGVTYDMGRRLIARRRGLSSVKTPVVVQIVVAIRAYLRLGGLQIQRGYLARARSFPSHDGEIHFRLMGPAPFSTGPLLWPFFWMPFCRSNLLVTRPSTVAASSLSSL